MGAYNAGQEVYIDLDQQFTQARLKGRRLAQVQTHAVAILCSYWLVASLW